MNEGLKLTNPNRIWWQKNHFPEIYGDASSIEGEMYYLQGPAWVLKGNVSSVVGSTTDIKTFFSDIDIEDIEFLGRDAPERFNIVRQYNGYFSTFLIVYKLKNSSAIVRVTADLITDLLPHKETIIDNLNRLRGCDNSQLMTGIIINVHNSRSITIYPYFREKDRHYP